MRFADFEQVMSSHRLSRYMRATGNDSRKAMKLYRLNLHASHALFIVILCFEVVLRNAIDRHYRLHWGNDWLRDAARPGEKLDSSKCGKTPEIVNQAIADLGRNYSHPKLIAKMDFGLWRYMFAKHQYNAFGKTLLAIFPKKPTSTRTHNYNNSIDHL